MSLWTLLILFIIVVGILYVINYVAVLPNQIRTFANVVLVLAFLIWIIYTLSSGGGIALR